MMPEKAQSEIGIEAIIDGLVSEHGRNGLQDAELTAKERTAVDAILRKDAREVGRIVEDKYGLGWQVLFDKLKFADEEEREKARRRYETVIEGGRISGLSADLIGVRTRFPVQITGEKTKKAIPQMLEVTCAKCGETLKIDLTNLDNGEVLLAYLFNGFSTQKALNRQIFDGEIGPCDEGRHKVSWAEWGHADYSILFVRDLLEHVDKFNGEVYKSRNAYLVGQQIPPVKKVEVYGEVVVHPKTRDLCVLANEIHPYEDAVANFTITEQDKQDFERYFAQMPVESMLPQIAPDMVGRPLVQHSRLLTLHSVHTILDIDGNEIRGCIRELYFGDTKTYKSKSGEDVISTFRVGEYIQAESSTRAGIAYTIDTDRRALIWGALPLNDLGYVVLTGLHSIFSEEMKELREILETQRIVVKKFVSDEALARVRITADFNPHKPLNQYVYGCQGLMDSNAFNEPPDVTRWDIFIPFADDDVDKRLIAQRQTRERPIPNSVFTRHIYWAWSRGPDDIEYTPEARDTVIRLTEDFMDTFNIASMPIVHNGFRDVLCRLSVAVACLKHSTDNSHRKIIVKSTHVEQAADFYREMLGKLALREYKEKTEGKLTITDNEFTDIVKDMDEHCFHILEEVTFEAKSSAELAEVLGCSERTVKRAYKKLKAHGLIDARPGRGATLSARGIKFVKRLSKNCGGSQDASAIVPETVPKYPISVENCPDVTMFPRDSSKISRSSKWNEGDGSTISDIVPESGTNHPIGDRKCPYVTNPTYINQKNKQPDLIAYLTDKMHPAHKYDFDELCKMVKADTRQDRDFLKQRLDEAEGIGKTPDGCYVLRRDKK